MKGRFQRFLHDQRGNAPLWAMFFIITFFMVAAVVYNAHAMYSNYYAVKDELTRCCAISLDANVVNSSLRWMFWSKTCWKEDGRGRAGAG